jgi:hypothetical protein
MTLPKSVSTLKQAEKEELKRIWAKLWSSSTVGAAAPSRSSLQRPLLLPLLRQPRPPHPTSHQFLRLGCDKTFPSFRLARATVRVWCSGDEGALLVGVRGVRGGEEGFFRGDEKRGLAFEGGIEPGTCRCFPFRATQHPSSVTFIPPSASLVFSVE